MKNAEIKVGDPVTPKKYPCLKGIVKKIGKSYDDKPLYILDNGAMYTEEEIKKDDK